MTNSFVKFIESIQPDNANEREFVVRDWVLSLEVTEHIPVDKTNAFLRNIHYYTLEKSVVS